METLRPVLYTTGQLLVPVGLAMIVPMLADLSVGNQDWQVFAVAAVLTLFLGQALVFANRGDNIDISVRQGYLLTVMIWVVTSAVGAFPFFFSSLQLSYSDAFFESISGLTTTGSTVLTDLDNAPPGILIWRGMLQWLGGIGIIAMAVLMLPFLRIGGMRLFRMESSDRSEKAMPRAEQVILRILYVYVFLSVLCALLYRLEGMSTLEAFVHAMTTLSTGGYSTSDSSVAHFHSAAVEWTAIVFMILASLPFVLYVKALHGRGFRALLMDGQIQTLIGFLAISSIGMALWLSLTGGPGFFESLRLSAFNITSVVTTTGYASADYAEWGGVAATVFFLLTFVGGCTGSTAGGFKIFRLQVAYSLVYEQVRKLLYPHGVFPARYNGQVLGDDVIGSVVVFFLIYLSSFVALTIALAWLGLDFVGSASGAATALANVGPGLGGLIGPSGNFSLLPDPAKWVLSFGMLLGRLELLTVLMLFRPTYWHEFGALSGTFRTGEN